MAEKIFFSEKEKEIIRLIWDELTRSEIALQLEISESAVEWRMSQIYEKLGLERNNQIGLIKYALKNQIIFLKID